jgi:hypothetical protein
MGESIRRVPAYYDALLKDDDFKAMREAPESAATLAAAKARYEEWKGAKAPEATPEAEQTPSQDAANPETPPGGDGGETD